MPDWLVKLTTPESLAVIGAISLTCGFVVRNFLKGLREGESKDAQAAPVDRTTVDLTGALVNQTNTLRHISEQVEGMHGQLRSVLTQSEKRSRTFDRVEELLGDLLHELKHAERQGKDHVEIYVAILAQIREEIKAGNQQRRCLVNELRSPAR